MIDILSEKPLIPLDRVPAIDFIAEVRPLLHVRTVKKWAKDGLRGVVLETVPVGRTPCTTEPALIRFFERLAATQQPQQKMTAKQLGKSHARTSTTLDKLLGN